MPRWGRVHRKHRREPLGRSRRCLRHELSRWPHRRLRCAPPHLPVQHLQCHQLPQRRDGRIFTDSFCKSTCCVVAVLASRFKHTPEPASARRPAEPTSSAAPPAGAAWHSVPKRRYQVEFSNRTVSGYENRIRN
jgi:hypothetical protein